MLPTVRGTKWGIGSLEKTISYVIEKLVEHGIHCLLS